MIRKKLLFIFRHFDFILVDLLAFVLGYGASLLLRESLHIRLDNREYFLAYAATAVFSFLLVELLSENLNGIVARGLVREIQSVFSQVTVTWTVFLSLLFLEHIIFGISRIFTVLSYILCGLFILLFRIFWKTLCKYSKFSRATLPKLLIVCEASRAQAVLERLLPGTLNNEYEICGVIMNEKGEPDYHDWYPSETGIGKIESFLRERLMQEAYVELADPEEEKEAIDRLLKAGIVVHRSLGDSRLQYAKQTIGELNGKTVITVSEARTSLVSRADQAWKQFRRRMHKEGEKWE